MWMNFSMSSSGVTILGDDLMPGPKRNFQIFDPLSRACGMAEVTQHIPEIGEHQIRYYGWYSNKKRGQRAKAEPAVAVVEPKDNGEKPLAPGGKQGRKRWAALIKQVYEVDPLSCPKCGAEMKTCPAVALAKVDRRFHRGKAEGGCGKDSPTLWLMEKGIGSRPAAGSGENRRLK